MSQDKSRSIQKRNNCWPTASIEDQTRLVLENLKAVLAADGLTLDSSFRRTVFLTDLADFAR